LSKTKNKKQRQQKKTMEKSRGLGDTVEKITTFTGIKAVVEAMSANREKSSI
jgi:hypothetical protein